MYKNRANSILHREAFNRLKNLKCSYPELSAYTNVLCYIQNHCHCRFRVNGQLLQNKKYDFLSFFNNLFPFEKEIHVYACVNIALPILPQYCGCHCYATVMPILLLPETKFLAIKYTLPGPNTQTQIIFYVTTLVHI